MITALVNRHWAAGLLLAALTLGVYSNAVPPAFVFDDAAVLLAPTLGGVETIPRLFVEPARPREFLYRPLAMASVAVDRSLYGRDFRGYHMTNIVLHLLATLAVFALLKSLSVPAPLFAAAVFAVHPIHTEAVDAVFNRSEILATLFVAVALVVLARGAASRPVLAHASASLLYFFALLSRESAVTLPALAAFVLWFGRPELERGRRLRLLIPLLALLLPLAVYLWMRSAALGLAGSPLHSVLEAVGYQSFSQRLGLVATTFRDYWRMMIWPWPLRATYQDYLVHGIGGAVALHGVLLAVVLAFRRQCPGGLLGVAFFYVALLPSSKLMTDPAWLAERFTYLPSVGFAIVVASLSPQLVRLGRPAATALQPALIAALALTAHARNRDWHSSTLLWEAEVRHGPHDWLALLNLSQAYLDAGRLEEVVDLCRRGAAVAPERSTLATNAGVALVGLGRVAEAETAFRRAVLLNDGDSEEHANLARLLVLTERRPEAAQAYAAAIAREPNLARQHLLRGYMLLQCHGDAEGAGREYQAALLLSPQLSGAIVGLRTVRAAGRRGGGNR